MNHTLQNRKNFPAPTVTISIVSHGDSKKVLHLLESICKYEQARSIQVIITDNLGNEVSFIDDSPWSSVVILRNKIPFGFARNHNQAFGLCDSDYFCILNPDVVFEQEVFTHLIELLKSDKADIVAPAIVDSSGVLQDSFRSMPVPVEILRRRLPGYQFVPASADTKGLIYPDWIAGIFLLLGNDTYRKLGGMNESYRLYFEDVEFCTRARLAGLNLCVDTRKHVRHDANRASRKKLIYLLWHIQSAVRFFTSSIYKKAVHKSKQ